MSNTQKNNNNLKGIALVYNGTLAYTSKFAEAAKISGISLENFAALSSKKFGIAGVVINYFAYENSEMSDAEKYGRTAVDLACFAIGCIPGVGVAGGSLAMYVADLALTKEQAEAIGSAIILAGETVGDVFVATGEAVEGMGNIALTVTSDVANCISSIDWNAVGEGLTSFFQVQAEMEMAFETYLPSDLDTTDVYATSAHLASPIALDLDGNGISTTFVKNEYVNFDLDGNGFAERTGWINAQDGFLVRDLNGNGKIDDGTEKPQSFAGQMPAPLRKGPRVSGNFYLPSFVKRVACVSKTGVLSVNKCAA